MPKGSIEVAKDPLRGPRGRPVSEKTFSVRPGLFALKASVQGKENEFGSAALMVLNDLTRGLTIGFLEEYKRLQQNVTMSSRDLEAVASILIKDKPLRDLNDTNVKKLLEENKPCCDYTEKRYTPPQKDKTLVFSSAYFKTFAKSYLGKSTRIGKSAAEALACRVQHIIGELLILVLSVAKERKDKRISTQHVQLALKQDVGLSAIFQLPGGELPAAAIGAGTTGSEMDVSDYPDAAGRKAKKQGLTTAVAKPMKKLRM